MGITTYVSDQIISSQFVGAFHVAAHAGDPGKSGANEVTTGQNANYARRPVTLAKAANGLIYESKNAADVSFSAASAGSNYSVTHLSIWSAASGGNCLATLELPAPIPVVSGTILTFAANDIVVRGE